LDKSLTQSKEWRYIFYDFESTQDEIDPETGLNIHKVNFAVAMVVCPLCPLGGSCHNCKQIHVFKGPKACDDFCQWALNPIWRRYTTTFIAHNGSGYDTHFIHEYMVRNGSYPEITTQGARIIFMLDQNSLTRWIDSYNFIASPLAKFPTTFSLHGIKKGFFPHLFNTMTNSGYDGLLPGLEYYDPDGMKEPTRSELICWYEENKDSRYVFNHIK